MTSTETGAKAVSAALDFELHGWLDQYERRWIEFSRGDAKQLHKLADIIQSPKKVFTALTNIGIAIVTQATKKAVEQEIEQIRAWAPTYIAETTGWHKGHYVFGDGTSVGPLGELPFKVAVEHSEKWGVAGRLEEWRLNVAEIASGQSRLVCALCLAFVPPLLEIIGQENFGVDLVARTSVGKVTPLLMASSVWGGMPGRSGGFMETWATTAEGAERLMLQHADAFLALDETNLADKEKKGHSGGDIPACYGKAESVRTAVEKSATVAAG